MKKTGAWILALLLFGGAAVLLIGLFLRGQAERAAERGDDEAIQAPARVSRTSDGRAVITLDAAAQRTIGLQTRPLSVVSFQPETPAYGVLEADPSRSFLLRAPAAGTVVPEPGSAWPQIGALVTRGARIGAVAPRLTPVDRVDLSSRRAAARGDVSSLQASLSSTRAEYERLRALNAENKNVSDRAVQEAEARMKGEEAKLAAARRRLRLLDNALSTRGGAADRLPLVIPRAGLVTRVFVQPGETVGSGQPLLRTERFDVAVARVAVPLGAEVNWGTPAARVAVMGHEDRPLAGRRIGVSAAGTGVTPGQFLLYRVRADGFPLRPGDAVTAYLPLAGKPQQGVIIPRDALVYYQGRAWVYVQTGANRFSRREADLEYPTARGWFVPSGFTPGDRVVVSGAQLLLSEEFRSQIQIED